MATAPARITNGQRQASPTTATAAVEMTMISMVAQPMFCAMLSTVGSDRAAAAEQPAQRRPWPARRWLTPNMAEAPSRTAPEGAADDDGGDRQPDRPGRWWRSARRSAGRTG